jgi:hypothetical protein
VSRVIAAWRNLGREQRLAAFAAGGLLLTMFLPWYEKKTTAVLRGKLVNAPADNLGAFQVFSFVEAAVLLVSLGVLVLLFQRGERKAFHLPGGDGTVIFAAGLWTSFLFFWRLFDKPDASGQGTTIGIQWGFLLAFVASGGLAYAGWRIRAAHRPEPPNPVAAPEPGAPETLVTSRAAQREAEAEARGTAVQPRPGERSPGDADEEARTVALPGEVPEPMDPPPAPDRLF